MIVSCDVWMMSEHPYNPLRAMYSTVAANEIAEFVAQFYSFSGRPECSLLNRGLNDTFLVQTSGKERYVFRLSRLNRRDRTDVAAETAFLAHLHRNGVPVAAPKETRDGSFFTTVHPPEGPRQAVLFRYLQGRRPGVFDPGDARLQGETLARIHVAASTFDGKNAGTHRTDVDCLLHRPLKHIQALSTLESDARKYLVRLAARLTTSVGAIGDLSQTRCHGDCHGANARIMVDGDGHERAAFFDFEDGGFGYLSYDLAVHLWAQTSFGRQLHNIWHAFVDGYRVVREITPSDFEAVHLFVAIRHFWLMGEYASRVGEWGTENISASWLNSQADFLREWEADNLSDRLF